jgi:hypothetical protein
VRPSSWARVSSAYMGAMKAPPSAARAGCVSSASLNFRRPWALHPASTTAPEAYTSLKRCSASAVRVPQKLFDLAVTCSLALSASYWKTAQSPFRYSSM